jgi:hypothetical protein
MAETNTPNQHEEDAISLVDIVQFIKESYKKVALLALGGLVCAAILTLALGQYTASITLLNYAELDIPRIKYLQATLPKLSQEESGKGGISSVGFEELWKSAIKINSLVKKSDTKDLIDPETLKSNMFNIYAIEMIAKANTKQLAEGRVQEISNFFVNGAVMIDLRDLVRRYELQVSKTDAQLGTKILNAEGELVYIERRIKTLEELKRQFPATTTSNNHSMNLVDSKGNSAKYLPVLMQIIAAIADKNNNLELLQRYKEEDSQMRIYNLFVEKAKPFLDTGLKDPKLLANLLVIVDEAKKTPKTIYEKAVLSTIEGDLRKIMAFKLYGLPQFGSISTAGPAYLKNIVIGSFGGAIVGILFALGLRVSQRLRAEMKVPSVQ